MTAANGSLGFIGGLGLLALATLAAVLPSFAQGGHYIDSTAQLPDTAWSTPLRRMSIPPAALDLRSTGMGRTRIADLRSQSWVTYSPALLARDTAERGLAGIYLDTPVQTIDAITFVSANAPGLDSAFALRALREAIEEYRAGGNVPADVLAKLDTFEDFVQQLLEKMIGDPSNPDVHNGTGGISAQMQLGHWGFSVSAYGQSGITIRMGSAFQELTKIYFATDWDDSSQVGDAINQIEALTDLIIDPLTGQLNTAAIPSIFNVTYADVVATAGYGMTLFDALDVGASLKVINRRFSVNRTSFAEVADLPEAMFRGLDYNVWGATLDLGAYYRTPSGIALGANLSNVIPFKKLSTAYRYDYNSVWLRPATDTAGNPVVDVNGDTAVIAFAQKNAVTGPAELDLPLVANIGASFPLTPDWDVSVELVDLFDEESKYPDYGERVGFGTEYRFRFFGDNLQVSPRAGYAQLNLTAGLGLSFAGIVRLDFAWFTSRYIDERKVVGGQLSVAW